MPVCASLYTMTNYLWLCVPVLAVNSNADAFSEALGDARRLGSCQYYSWGHLLAASREILRHTQPRQAVLVDPSEILFATPYGNPRLFLNICLYTEAAPVDQRADST